MPAPYREPHSSVSVHIPFVTTVLIGLNVAVFCYLSQFLTSAEASHTALIHLGANVAVLTLSGEAWRLIFSLFLHDTFSHLLVNMLALAVIGFSAERQLGKWRLLAVYFLSGISASLVSACYALRDSGADVKNMSYFLFSVPQVVISLGASGAIMGVAGATIIALVFIDPTVRSEHDRRVAYSLSGIVVLTLLSGTRLGIDNASHVGGLCMGGALSFAWVLLGSRQKWLTEALLFCACALLLATGTWLSQRQIDDADLQIRANLRHKFYPLSIEKERQQKRQVLVDERDKHMEKLPEPVSDEEASGIILADIPDIQDIALSQDGRTLYAAVEDKNIIVVYSLVQHKVLSTFMRPVRDKNDTGRCSHCGDRGVRALTLSPDETLLYATGFEPDSLSVISVTTGEVIQTITTGRSPDAIVMSRDGKRAWVMNRTSNSISIIDLELYQQVGNIPLEKYDGVGRTGYYGIGPIAISPDEKMLLVPGMGSSDIVRIDTTTRQKVDYPAGETRGTTAVVGFRPENGAVIFADSQGISRVDPVSQQPTLLAQWCSQSRYSVEAISPDSHYIALLTYGIEGYAVLLNVDASQIVGVFPASYVRHLRFSADGKKLYMLGEKTLTVVDRVKSLAPRDLIRHSQFGDVACLPEVEL